MARGIEEGNLARFAVKLDRHLVCADALGDAASLTSDHVGLADGIQQAGLTVIDMAHDRDHRRTRLEVLVVLQLFLIKVDVELPQQLLVFLFSGDNLDVPADFLTKNLEGRLVEGLGRRGHLTEMEQDCDERRRIDIDFLSKIRKGRALTQTHSLAVACGDAHTGDDRGLHLLIFMTLRETVLARLRGLAALTTECTCGTATTTATAAGWTGIAATVLEAATEMIAASTAVCAGTLARTMLAPLPRTSTAAVAETIAAATATASTTTFDSRARHGVRTRDVTRSGHVHALLAAERIVARTRPRSRGMRRTGTLLRRGALGSARRVWTAGPWARTITTRIVTRTALLTVTGIASLAVVATVVAALGTVRTTTLLRTLAGMRPRMRCTRLRHMQMCRPRLRGIALA